MKKHIPICLRGKEGRKEDLKRCFSFGIATGGDGGFEAR